jgi:sugar phosphate isomerase/epimerase
LKLSVITDEISTDLAHALDVMGEYGVRVAELRNLWNTNISDLNEAQIDWARKLLAQKGVAVCCLATPLYKCELGEAGSEAAQQMVADQIDRLNGCIRLCDEFGTRLIRIFSFLKRGEMTEAIESRIVEILQESAAIAEKAGVVLVLENEHACYHGTGAEAARLLAKVNSPAMRAVWDPGNAFFAGEHPFPDGYKALEGRVEHVHLKDAERLATGRQRFVNIGEGEIDYPAQLAALKADGYQGYISLETHYKPYAGTKEQGSRMCLAALNSMLIDIT